MRRISSHTVVALLTACFFVMLARTRGAEASSGITPAFRLPPGFVIERVAGPPQIRFPMFGAFDNEGRLYITESGGGDLYEDLQRQRRTCRVSVLEDQDRDGKFEHIRVFAEQFVPSMGIAWRDGKLYVADPPDLVTLQDTDNDGRADRREVILSGFGHTDNGSLHGLVFGPDGLLYMTMGWPDGYHLRDRSGRTVRGKTGALLRCRPDGSSPEVLARGFDQLIEIVFLPGGEIVGSQTWYQNPSGGIRDSLTHLVPEGFYPQRWQDEEPSVFITGDTLPAVLMMPAIAHSGITLYSGAQFPAEWRGQLFSAQFNTRKVVRHPLTPAGSTFASDSFDFMCTDDPDFRPADVLEDADGSLLVLDTGSWYVQHCPTGRMRASAAPGAIYRVRPLKPARQEDPRGLKLGWVDVAEDVLVKRLDDPRVVVRERTVEALVKCGPRAARTCGKLLEQRYTTQEAQLCAVWILARVGGEEALQALRRLLGQQRLRTSSPDPVLSSACARALALHRDQRAAPALEQLLTHTNVHVRLAAAESLAACGRRESVPALMNALASDPDRMLEHALTCALGRYAAVDELRTALKHTACAVRKAALLVLDQAPHRSATPDEVLPFLSSPNASLRAAAEFCLRSHPDWAHHALQFVRRELQAPHIDPARESALLELLKAFQSHPLLPRAIAGFLMESDQAIPPPRKITLVTFISQTARQPWPAEWIDIMSKLLAHSSADVRAAAVRAVNSSATNSWDPLLWRIARQTNEEPRTRVEAVASLARRHPQLDRPALSFLLAQLAPANAYLARLRAAEVFALTEPPPEVLENFINVAAAETSISPNLVLTPARRVGLAPTTAAALVPYLIESIERGWPMSQSQLDWVLKTTPDSVRAQAAKLQRLLRTQATNQQTLLTEYKPLLTGGDPTRGRTLFFDKAQCFTCHTVGNQGRPVGPDLTKVGAIRSAWDLLESVLLPSVTFAQGFETFLADTRDGESITGSLVRETADYIVLRNASGTEMLLHRSDIETLAKSRLSMMPEGLLQALTREEVTDLFAFLQDLK